MMDDKRVVYADIYGKQYPLCLTVLTHEKICQEWGGIEQMAREMDAQGERAIPITAKLLSFLMEGGVSRIKALAWMEGTNVENLPKVPSAEILNGLLVLEDISALQEKVFAAIRASKETSVEVEEPKNTVKNAETTQ